MFSLIIYTLLLSFVNMQQQQQQQQQFQQQVPQQNQFVQPPPNQPGVAQGQFQGGQPPPAQPGQFQQPQQQQQFQGQVPQGQFQGQVPQQAQFQGTPNQQQFQGGQPQQVQGGPPPPQQQQFQGVPPAQQQQVRQPPPPPPQQQQQQQQQQRFAPGVPPPQQQGQQRFAPGVPPPQQQGQRVVPGVQQQQFQGAPPPQQQQQRFAPGVPPAQQQVRQPPPPPGNPQPGQQVQLPPGVSPQQFAQMQAQQAQQQQQPQFPPGHAANIAPPTPPPPPAGFDSNNPLDSAPGIAMEYKVHVEAGKEDCYWQYVHQGATLYVSYQVLKGGDGAIGMAVRNPSTKVVHPYAWKASSEYEESDVPMGGYYSVCLDNQFSRFSAKLVNLYLTTFRYDEWEKFSQELQDMDVTVENFTGTLRSVDQRVQIMRQFQSMTKGAESRDLNLIIGNGRYVQTWSIIQIAIVIICTIVQVQFVKRLFSDPRDQKTGGGAMKMRT